MHRVLLVGGGTAGHVEPALAVGHWLLANGGNISCEFVGTKSGVEKDLVPSAGLKLHTILKCPMPRKVNASTFIWPLRFLVAIFQAAQIVKSADLVLGFGGYVSAPCYIAAKICGVPLIVHEANVLPGWANKLGARFATERLVAFEGTKRTGDLWTNSRMVGMPIREDIFAISKMSKSDRSVLWNATYRELGLDRTRKTIFVFGGSLGAQSINRAIESALPQMLERGFNIIHGIGQRNNLAKRAPGYVPLSYISNMASMYVASDLVISRGGAVTCAELDAANCYALVVPLPIGNGEQVANASELIAKGSAEICGSVDFTGDWLLANIDRLMADAQIWNTNCTPELRTPAAEIIGKAVLEKLVGRVK
jgi:UDP-N-acetylglucosamine--N-acetylmuramyl-(pentapeptide) pyrophosphoryl-undecaprenol N-acetylglucosamine transferase